MIAVAQERQNQGLGELEPRQQEDGRKERTCKMVGSPVVVCAPGNLQGSGGILVSCLKTFKGTPGSPLQFLFHCIKFLQFYAN